jgi:hypothetical protein
MRFNLERNPKIIVKRREYQQFLNFPPILTLSLQFIKMLRFATWKMWTTSTQRRLKNYRSATFARR